MKARLAVFASYIALFVTAACARDQQPAPVPPADSQRLLVSLRAGVSAAAYDPDAFPAIASTVDYPELEKIGVVVLEAPSSDVASVMAQTAGLEAVEAVEVDQVVRLIEPITVTAPVMYPSLRAVDAFALDPLVSSQYQHQRTRSPDAWARGVVGTGVVVAILDTGIDCSHPDLRCVAGRDFTGSGGTGDGHGHGTHVAGIAGAVGGNGVGGSGIAAQVRVQPVRVLSSSGEGTWSGIASGITWAADNGASVMNMSLGGSIGSVVLERAIDYARNKGRSVICAAGNEATSNPTYPASYNGCLGVGATDSADRTASFSNYGVNAKTAFPGVSILSTCRGGAHCTMSGTSMAAPGFAGAVALCMAAGLPASRCESDIKATGDAVTGRLAGLTRANLERASPGWVIVGPTPSKTAAPATATARPTEVRPTPFPSSEPPPVPSPDPSQPAPPVTNCRVVAVEADDVVVRCSKPRP